MGTPIRDSPQPPDAPRFVPVTTAQSGWFGRDPRSPRDLLYTYTSLDTGDHDASVVRTLAAYT